MKKHRLIVICGPTGVGKTSVAIELAEKFKGEIVGADSMQVYRQMDIGTAKPTAKEQARIPHHMIDVVDPDEPFDAAKYSEMAGRRILRLEDKGVASFVVGGTGLYIKALVHGLSRARPADSRVLERLKKEAKEQGGKVLHERLSRIDKDAAQKIHHNDIFRIVRALEIFEKTGKPLSDYNKEHGFKEKKFDALKICLHSDREVLYDRIETRVDEMLSQGFVKEVKDLLEMGYSKDLKSMQSIGYSHMVKYLSRDLNRDEAVRTMKRDSRRYAKRQFTWFRADPEVKWVKPDKLEDMIKMVGEFLKDSERHTSFGGRETST
jgi:tRNA dimethylallyltransferase